MDELDYADLYFENSSPFSLNVAPKHFESAEKIASLSRVYSRTTPEAESSLDSSNRDMKFYTLISSDYMPVILESSTNNNMNQQIYDEEYSKDQVSEPKIYKISKTTEFEYNTTYRNATEVMNKSKNNKRESKKKINMTNSLALAQSEDDYDLDFMLRGLNISLNVEIFEGYRQLKASFDYLPKEIQDSEFNDSKHFIKKFANIFVKFLRFNFKVKLRSDCTRDRNAFNAVFNIEDRGLYPGNELFKRLDKQKEKLPKCLISAFLHYATWFKTTYLRDSALKTKLKKLVYEAMSMLMQRGCQELYMLEKRGIKITNFRFQTIRKSELVIHFLTNEDLVIPDRVNIFNSLDRTKKEKNITETNAQASDKSTGSFLKGYSSPAPMVNNLEENSSYYSGFANNRTFDDRSFTESQSYTSFLLKAEISRSTQGYQGSETMYQGRFEVKSALQGNLSNFGLRGYY